MTEWQNGDIPRDRWGRPMVMPPKGNKRIAYRRATTFVGCLDDTNGLMKWMSRQVALGMGQRKDLVLAAAAADPADKRKLGEIADKAAEHAKGLVGDAAETGTALHSLTERIDRGEPLGVIPAEYKADIEAYRRATEHVEFIGIETFRVHDDWKVAGTADRIGLINGRPMIMDIKTGSIDFPHKMAMQLAMYSRSTPYDIASDTRTADPKPVDLNYGVIIHLPAGQGRCDLYEIDIAKGWGACLIAKQVWDWRGTKGLTHEIGTTRITTWEQAGRSNERKDELAELLEATAEAAILDAGNLEELRKIWHSLKEQDRLTLEAKAAAARRAKELGA